MIDDRVSRPHGLQKFAGSVRNYRCTRGSASFVFTKAERGAMGMVAIAAGVAGLSGPAISTAAQAGGTEEEADYVEFELNGKPFKGWLWRSPLSEGDEVDVAAEWQADHYEVRGVARPRDRTIALYPHCSRGRSQHIRNSIFWWGAGTTGVILWGASLAAVMNATAEFGVGASIAALVLFALALPFLWLRYGTTAAVSIVLVVAGLGMYESWHLLQNVELVVAMSWCLAGLYAFFALMTYSLSRRWMPFVVAAEKVFATLGFSSPARVDLVKTSKLQRTEDDPSEFGTFFFRY